MAIYIVLVNFTDQGVRNIKDTTKPSAIRTGSASVLSGRRERVIVFAIGSASQVQRRAPT